MQPACLGAVQRAAGTGSGLSWSDGGDRVITTRGDRGDMGVPCAAVRRRNGNQRERDNRGQCSPQVLHGCTRTCPPTPPIFP